MIDRSNYGIALVVAAVWVSTGLIWADLGRFSWIPIAVVFPVVVWLRLRRPTPSKD